MSKVFETRELTFDSGGFSSGEVNNQRDGGSRLGTMISGCGRPERASLFFTQRYFS